MKRHLNIKSFVTGLLLAVGSAGAQTSIYFAAHEDDWQLFMGIDAYNDLQLLPWNLSNRVVFIYTTAGDAGVGMTGGYVAAREACCMNSVWLATSPPSTNNPPGSPVIGFVNVNGHTIRTQTYGSVVSYFLRLPDGCGTAIGCVYSTSSPPPAGSPAQSLWDLYNGTPNLKARDNSAVYANWEDLRGTIQAIMQKSCDYDNQVSSSPTLWVHMPDVNPNAGYVSGQPFWGDHPDHLHTGMLAEQAGNQLSCCPHFVGYVDYQTGNLPPNLNTDEIETEAGLLGACSLGIADGGYANDFEGWHKQFLDKNYYRTWDNCLPTIPNGKVQGGTSTTPDPISGIAEALLYPQPASDKLNVSYTIGGVAQSITRIEVQDVVGKHTVATSEGQNTIDLAALKPGIYFAKIYNQSNKFILKKFVKQ